IGSCCVGYDYCMSIPVEMLASGSPPAQWVQIFRLRPESTNVPSLAPIRRIATLGIRSASETSRSRVYAPSYQYPQFVLELRYAWTAACDASDDFGSTAPEQL